MPASERHRFPSTQWSVVLAAVRGGSIGSAASSEIARGAFATLCETYWYPLYAFARHRGHDAESARDLTQGFFASLLARPRPLSPDRERGRFRSYLLGAMKHYLANERDRDRARRRGGGEPALRLDFADGERRYRLDPADQRTPETLYEHRWALALLDAVLCDLERECHQSGRAELFRHLRPLLAGESERGTYAALAQELSMSEGALKVAVHRLRRRYRQLLRATVARTVAAPGQVDEELRHLLAVVGP